jgi:hypothetical protein
MFLDLNTDSLFGNHNQALVANPSQVIRSKESKSNNIYINAKFDHLKANNIFNTLD